LAAFREAFHSYRDREVAEQSLLLFLPEREWADGRDVVVSLQVSAAGMVLANMGLDEE